MNTSKIKYPVLPAKKLVASLVFLCLGFINFAQTSNNLFKTANAFYQKGDYDNALKNYNQIEKQNVESADLYYNLGNTYYKLNKVAPAIYYFEKALKLDPNNEDFKNNLTVAQRMTIDKINILPKTFLQKLDQTYIKNISFETWAKVAIVSIILFVLFFLAYYFSVYSNRKRLYFVLATISIITVLFSFSFAYSGNNYNKTHRPAIIFLAKANVKNAPTLNSTEAFELHEGTKVIILEQVDGWFKIKLADGKLGWISKTDLKVI